ncbi:MAG: Lrp/AsnC family transcriptional regulator [Deltaproteobacteria bacterium]|nr:Lrp/AsnC family transcriptional regulator [Deltaproteobacteria bacterium]MBW1934001.1 Lrp/AsnC family transcriptional regulator [Deltaproteobacteria bacterium]MBW1978514.1 Lrp/AsnC family transcriptional regulator [Deltaproteobacteria bacterium]MBW2044778.1 Lrp/AsnC family transcriptional regulator [Deltaproteobacteria bacterium]MBW2300000.1 Lrp/AsnC family transcriptional regulator [Deltaproteobacteria bacterium]
MKNDKLDALDKKLAALLVRDGRISAGKAADLLEITPPTVRSRIENLVSSGVLRISGLLNAAKVRELNIALVGICLESHRELDQKIEQISKLSRIHWAAVVTGRFDIIAEVVTPEGIEGLYRFLTQDLPRVGGIRSSESFMVMKSKRKWILLPETD